MGPDGRKFQKKFRAGLGPRADRQLRTGAAPRRPLRGAQTHRPRCAARRYPAQTHGSLLYHPALPGAQTHGSLLYHPALPGALTHGSASLLSRATTRARPGQAARCRQRAASGPRSAAVVGASDRAGAGRGEPGRGDGRASWGFGPDAVGAAGRSEVQPRPARAARARPHSRGAGAAVRRDPVRAGAAAHPGYAAERGRDRSADLAGLGGRAR
jgi:hypothetical protein